MTSTTYNAEGTKKLAKEFAARLSGGELVALIGDLGAGKTTFVQGLAEALGVKTHVKSPTFTVMREYRAEAGTIRRLVHIDLYRFNESGELRALELDNERRPNTVVLMEWPNMLPDVDWNPDHTVTISHGATADERVIVIE